MNENIKNIDIDRLHEILGSLGLKSYAHKQVFQWLYKHCAKSFDDMTDLSKDARAKLSQKYSLSWLKPADVLEDKDGTKKFVFKLSDGKKIESVLIPSEDERQTLCISSQVGCALNCLFCRTGKLGFQRNLSQSEIIDQVLYIKNFADRLGGVLTNLVFMGMGEPLENYENVRGVIKILVDENGVSLSKRRITLSTAGIVPMIHRMSQDNLGIKLAISLNATTDELRKRIMPIGQKYKIDDIIEACLEYNPPGSRWRTTFEYVLINGLNDTPEDAKRLVALMSRLPSKVNLIPFNPFPGCGLEKPTEEVLNYFYEYLYNKRVQVNVRKSRGEQILAACGQLAME